MPGPGRRRRVADARSGGRAVAKESTTLIGRTLGPYQILEKLGEGGMGEVYRGRDPRLGRDVAIKVLPDAFAADPDRLERFHQEARAIAALDHAHICRIYDIGPRYLVLEYVRGAPLQGPMTSEEVIRIGIQIAGALEAAHLQGILHRDLKPTNVMLTVDGTAKLLDFGLAKMMASDADVTRTASGLIVGTVAYMSPEQAQGRPVDARTDVFSFGALMYELISGRRAFGGGSPAAVLSALLRDEPPAPTGAPPDLQRIVMRCLAKDPARRFASMRDVGAALEQVASGAPRQPSIAVLPFADLSPARDHEWFSDGLAEEIINALTRVPGVKVIARTSAFAFKGKAEDIRRIADALGVAHVLEGSVRKAGDRVRVTAQLITASDGSHLWSDRYDRDLADVFAIQDDIAGAIANALRLRLGAGAERVRRHTPPLAAYEALLKGRHHMLRFHPSAVRRAREHFDHAMALDAGYAEPHLAVGFSSFFLAMHGYASLRESMPMVRSAARTALAIDPGDTRPHYLLGAVAAAFDYDWQAAAEHFSRAVSDASAPAEAHWAYASLYLQPLGRFEEAVAEMERAVELDPLNVFWRGVLVSHLTHARQYDRAIAEAREALELDETGTVPHHTLGEVYVDLGRWQEAADAFGRMYRSLPDWALSTGGLAGVLARMGNRTRAEALVREMGPQPRPPMGRVLYHVFCDEFEAAAEWYERAIEERDPFALVFAAVPAFDGFRRSGHWPRIASLMRLPPHT
jgi:serine/threonine-protein kinase